MHLLRGTDANSIEIVLVEVRMGDWQNTRLFPQKTIVLALYVV